MAVDPATIKAVAKVAVSVLTNKETRSNLLYIILIALVVGVAIILIPIYLLTHPLEMLEAAFADSPDDAAYIEQYKLENDDKVLVIGEGLIIEDAYPLPVIGATVTSEYGERTDPITGAQSFHHGTDFGGEWRSEIFSIADGVVMEVCTEKKGRLRQLYYHKAYRRTNRRGRNSNKRNLLCSVWAYERDLYVRGAIIKERCNYRTNGR